MTLTPTSVQVPQRQHVPADRNVNTDAAAAEARQGATIWLTGLPGAGKSTIAEAAAERLRHLGHAVQVLDGDEVRAFLSAGLGFSRADRDANVQRIGYVAELLARNGVKVLAAVISPYGDSRAAVRARHEAAGSHFLEIHVATPVEVCAERDVKGLYARQRSGNLTGLTGVDDPYEPPADPDLRIETHAQDVAASAEAVLALLAERGLA